MNRWAVLLGSCAILTACGSATDPLGIPSGAGGSAGAAGTGGAGYGGSIGKGGAAGQGGGVAGAGGSTTFAHACKSDTDCRMQSDCCRCEALSATEPSEPCDSPPCYVDSCTGHGVTGTHCGSGQCVLNASCNPFQVACNALPPACETPGEIAVVDGQGLCWAGWCIAASQCDDVGTCSLCDPGKQVCVHSMGRTRCVDRPPQCEDAAKMNCACLAPLLCVGIGEYCFDSTGGMMPEINCEAPVYD